MKTYEGKMRIWWSKNLSSVRAVTFDVADKKELDAELNRVRNEFMTKGEDPSVAHVFNTQQYVGEPAIKVSFDLTERE